MVNFCCVVGCSNRSNRDNVSFYGIPTISLHHGEFKRKLSIQRREKWLASIGRQNWEPSKSSRVCSRHFVGGKPCYLHSFDHPDWVPTLYMDGSNPSHPTTAKRMKRSRKRKTEVAAEDVTVPKALIELPPNSSDDGWLDDDDSRSELTRIKYVITRGIQTDLTQIDLAKKVAELEECNTALRKSVRRLAEKVKSYEDSKKKESQQKEKETGKEGEIRTGLPSWTAYIPCSALPPV